MFEFVHHHLHGVGRRKEDGGGVHDLLHRVEAVEFASEDDFAGSDFINRKEFMSVILKAAGIEK